MYLIDTHCHLHDREFFTDTQAAQMLKNAHARDIKQIICIGTNHTDSLAARDFALKHKNVFWTYGIHPEAAGKPDFSFLDYKKFFQAFSEELPSRARVPSATEGQANSGEKLDEKFQSKKLKSGFLKLAAIGEIGLDYHYPGYNRQNQIKLLEQMLDLAIKLDLPCSFHVREAFDDFFAVTQNFPDLKPSVLHSFTDNQNQLDYALNHDFYIGINGILVNHSEEFDWTKDLGNHLPLDRIVLETDAPFLTPAPNRGKINEPGNVADVATWLANKIGVSREEIAERTTKNARTIFNLPNPEPV